MNYNADNKKISLFPKTTFVTLFVTLFVPLFVP